MDFCRARKARPQKLEMLRFWDKSIPKSGGFFVVLVAVIPCGREKFRVPRNATKKREGKGSNFPP